MKYSSLIPVERIENAIYLIRGEKVMLDRDLAEALPGDYRIAQSGFAAKSRALPG